MLVTGRRIVGGIALAGLCLPVLLPSCGSKSGLREIAGDAGVDAADDVPAECITTDDCFVEDLCAPSECVEGRCVPAAPIVCNDFDECTEDECVPESGECRFRALARDEDGDGFKGPRPGFAAGAPGSCGDDCDDTNPNAFPGGIEICDGVDNDCNGVIDDNADYVPVGKDAIRVSELDAKLAGGGGLAWNGELYAATYTAQEPKFRSYAKGLAPDGTPLFPQTGITNTANDTFVGPVIWTGSVFGVAWSDRRAGNNYEIWFNRLDAQGKKLGPDIQVTDAINFSLDPSLIWNGAEFLLAWSDDRQSQLEYRIYGQRLDPDGNLLGGNVELTGAFTNAESPSIAEGEKKVALAFNRTMGQDRWIGFRLFDPDFSNGGPLIDLDSPNGVSPTVVWNKDRYVVTYTQKLANASWGKAIWALTIDENGNLLTPAKDITGGSSFARTHSMLPLGDRLLLVWGDHDDGNYELYTKLLTPTLDELTPRKRITVDAGWSLGPIAAFGPQGDVGILFDDNRSGSQQVYFTRLVCQAGPGG
jgi:hypothetical protein